eukprot:tig00000114_g6027.t1
MYVARYSKRETKFWSCKSSKLKQLHGSSILPDALRFDELCYLVRQEALLQWEARAGEGIRDLVLVGRPLEWVLGTRIDAAALARETKRMFLDFSLECFDYVDETTEARSYVPRPIDTREIRGLSLDPVTRFPAIVDFVVKHWLDVRLWQWPLLFLDGEYNPRKTSSFLSQVELSAPSMDPQRRVVWTRERRVTWASNWLEWNTATSWPPQFGPVNLPEEVKREFGQFGEISGAVDPVEVGAGAGAGAAPAASRAGAMGGYLKAMCWDDPVEYLRKIAACGFHLESIDLLAQSKHAEFCRRLINAGCLAPTKEELDALEAMSPSPLNVDPPVLPALYVKPFCLLSRATKDLYIALATAQLENLLDLLYFGAVARNRLDDAQPDARGAAPHFTLKLRFLSRLKV